MTDITSSFTDARGFLYRDGMLDPDSAQKLTATALANCEDGELYLLGMDGSVYQLTAAP